MKLSGSMGMAILFAAHAGRLVAAARSSVGREGVGEPAPSNGETRLGAGGQLEVAANPVSQSVRAEQLLNRSPVIAFSYVIVAPPHATKADFMARAERRDRQLHPQILAMQGDVARYRRPRR